MNLSLDWKAFSGNLDLQDCPKASCVTHSWELNLFGPGLLNGLGFKKLCPQLIWRAVRVGATRLDRCPALGLSCRASGAKKEVSPNWVYGMSLACPQLV